MKWKLSSKNVNGLRIYQQPKLENPILIAAWGCLGRAGIEAVSYLNSQLKTELLAEIEPYRFFPFHGVKVKQNLIGLPALPETKFYFGEADDKEFIFCLADAEPPWRRYQYTNLILDLAKQFGVSQIYTACALTAPIHHSENPVVLGTANHPELADYLREQEIVLIRKGNLVSMNGLLLSVGRQRGIAGIYILTEVPLYLREAIAPKSAKAILEVLGRMLALKVETTEFDFQSQYLEEKLAELAEKAVADEEAKEKLEYIESFRNRRFDRAKYYRKIGYEIEEAKISSEKLLREIEEFLQEKRKGEK
jgi:proteasome assembly chaperone (PAC2) family protein